MLQHKEKTADILVSGWVVVSNIGTGTAYEVDIEDVLPAGITAFTYINGSSTLLNTESAPQAEKVRFVFPARKNMEKVKMPAVKVHWYDGGIMPSRPDELPDNEPLMDDGMGACLFVGTKAV